MPFEFATAGRIVFGGGMLRAAAPAAAAMGRRAMVVTGSSGERAVSLLEALPDAVRFPVAEEPTVELVRAGTELARAEGCDVVVAIGGGSAIDAGKALSAMLANPGDPLDYLEVIGAGKLLANPAAPCIAIPTTAGTGSEVTRNAVLASRQHRVKASLRSAGMLPHLAIVDPELTYRLPRGITASTGLDALTQLIEPYVSVRANPMADLFCAEGIRCAAAALSRLAVDLEDRAARSDMAWAALLGGLSLANAGLGAVHGFAAPLGGSFPIPHGAACAAVLPFAMQVNIRALRQRAPGSQPLRRYDEIARLITGRPHASAEDGVRWVAELCRRWEIPPLRHYGVTAGDILPLVEKAAQSSSMKANPIALTPAEMQEIVTLAREG